MDLTNILPLCRPKINLFDQKINLNLAQNQPNPCLKNLPENQLETFRLVKLIKGMSKQ